MSAYGAGLELHAAGAAQAGNHSSNATGAATSLSQRPLVIIVVDFFDLLVLIFLVAVLLIDFLQRKVLWMEIIPSRKR